MTTEQAFSIFEQLLAALHHPNPTVRAGAAIALGKTGSAKAVEPLADLLEDPTFLVYTSAARALGTLGSLGVGSLIAVIQDPPSLDSASRAYEALRGIRDPQATGLLIAATGYDDTYIRWGAIEALGSMQTEQAIPALLEAARHPDETTRLHAVIALGKIGDPNGVHAVTALLNESNWQLRVAAAQALGEIGTEATILPLLAMMHEPMVQVREAAAHALQKLRDPQAAEIILPALNGADAWMRHTLTRALGEIGNQIVLPLLENLALEEDDVKVRLGAAQSLAKMGHPRGEAVILRTLNAPSAKTRTLAAIALGNTGNSQAVSILLGSDAVAGKPTGTIEARELRQEIVASLASAGLEAVPQLAEALESPYPGVRETAFSALHEIGTGAIPGLLTAFETTIQQQARRNLIRLFGAIADTRAVTPLVEVLRKGVNSAFSPRLLTHALYDPGAEERKLAADALGQIRALDSVGSLLASARFDLDKEVRDRAAQALAEIGEAESILRLAEPQVLGELNRALISTLVLLVMGFVTGGLMELIGDGRLGILAGLGVGAVFGTADGLNGQKRAVRGALAGVFLVIVWGVFVQIFDGSPPLQELLQSPLVRVGALLVGGGGAIVGGWLGNSFIRENQRPIPRGCLFVLFPVISSVGGILAGGVTGAVILLRASDPAFFRYLGGISLGVLFLAVWFQRGKRIDLQQGLLLGAALLGGVAIGTALALSVPVSAAGWVAFLLLSGGALYGWQSLPLFRRLAGLFVGMVVGFVGAGLAVLVMPLVGS